MERGGGGGEKGRERGEEKGGTNGGKGKMHMWLRKRHVKKKKKKKKGGGELVGGVERLLRSGYCGCRGVSRRDNSRKKRTDPCCCVLEMKGARGVLS